MMNNSPTYLSDLLPTSTWEIKWPRLYLHSTNGVESYFKTITVCSWSFPLICFPSKAGEQMQRCPGKSALHLCPVVTEFFMIIFLVQKQESDQTLCWQGLPLDWFHHKCAPSQECLHGPWLTNPNFSASSLSLQVQGSSDLVSASAAAKMLCIITEHSVVLSELCSSWLALEHIPPAWGRDRGELMLQSADTCPMFEWGEGTLHLHTGNTKQDFLRLSPFLFPFLSYINMYV